MLNNAGTNIKEIKMTTMNQIEQCWEDGYLEGWREQSTVANPPNPTIPAFPGGIPSGHQDPCQFARDLGRKEGRLARVRVQAGIH